MKLYWTIGSIPELKQFDQAERRRLWRMGYINSLQKPVVIASLIICGICCGLGGLISSMNSDSFLGLVTGAGIGGGIGGAIFGQVATVYVRRFLAANLNRSGTES